MEECFTHAPIIIYAEHIRIKTLVGIIYPCSNPVI